ncbi:hypothetical protein CYMTET_17916 [Cymbomonas tetramitiformis]|uniref:Uncharacterized protein n=1 Tax=Cymbomonas tetramitiformis TaxID=36881 RepID=A0AAE0G938_9CHLO|nr:hypothetical protein CYMTET_17916 [Cymbomonas tetramitiformis]
MSDSAVGGKENPASLEEALSYIEPEAEVQLSACEPKVFVPFVVKKDEVPRKVQIERKKRHFAAQDIGNLLAAEGINSFASQPSGEELAIFDDYDFDTRTQEEWVAPEALKLGVGVKVARYPPGGGPPTWVPATVLGCDPETNHYNVSIDHGQTLIVPRPVRSSGLLGWHC